MEKLLKSYEKEIYIEIKHQLSSFVSELPDVKIKELLSEIEKLEDKKTEIYIGIKEKCSVDELEKALRDEIQNREEDNIQKTTLYPSLDEIKTSPDFSEIIEIKRK